MSLFAETTSQINALEPVHTAQAYYEPLPEHHDALKPPQNELCNCYKYLRGIIPDLPRQDLLKSNTTPIVGAVVLFEYTTDDGSIIPHVAKILSIEETGFWIIENNYVPCETGKRFVKWNDPSIKGFSDPASY